MNRRLADERCEPCREGERPLSGEDLGSLCESLPLWKLESQDGVLRLAKTFAFRDEFDSRVFARRLADLAAGEDHHPETVLERKTVVVLWWTHRIRGLHRNDFIMAAKTDRLADPGF